MLPPGLQKYVCPRTSDADFFGHWSGCRIRRSFYTGTLHDDTFLGMGSEIPEAIDLIETINTARDEFTMIELGAGFGRWLVAGATMATRCRQLRCRLIGVEAEHCHFRMMRQHFLDNDLDPRKHKLIEGAVSDKDGQVYFANGHPREWWGQFILESPDAEFEQWPDAEVKLTPAIALSTILSEINCAVDLIDMDIQGAEAKVVSAATKMLSEKTKRVHIATHGHDIEDELRSIFSRMNWRNRWDLPLDTQDGVQSWINPRFTN